MKNLMPTYFLSHGGGPWPWLKKEMPFFDKLEKSLQEIPSQLPSKPKAILMVSGHWETSDITVMTNSKPGMLYDYYGFPPHTYDIEYPAAGSPELAVQVMKLLQDRGFNVAEDSARGFDHGAFVPLYEIYPKADIPVVQLSIQKDFDPELHIKIGRALKSLRGEGVLIIGSGLSFHNLRAMLGDVTQAKKPSIEFDQWLNETLLLSNSEERVAKLIEWAKAPAARFAHPREDHLIPLMVALGAAESDTATSCYKDMYRGNIAVSGFKFG